MLWDVCQETDTVVSMHIGSSSKVARTAPDSPHLVSTTLFFEYAMHAVIDWVISGTLARFPTVRIALSEAQVGWLREIGYDQADCYFKWLELAVFGGVRPGDPARSTRR